MKLEVLSNISSQKDPTVLSHF